MHRERLKRIGAEPLSELSYVFAAGVVEMLARSKDFDCLCAGSLGQFEVAWVQAMVEE